MYNGDVSYAGDRVEFRGKTDKAEMYPGMLEALEAIFIPQVDKFMEAFGERQVCFYGEGVGCFPYTTGIVLEDYSTLPIGKVVADQYGGNIWTYNFRERRAELSKILNYFKYPNSKLIKISLTKIRKGGSGRYNQIVCTPNHLIYTDGGYKPACDIQIGDKVMALQRDLSYIQRQVLLGTLLGDGSISNSGYEIRISHSEKQKGYVALFEHIFDNVHITKSSSISGHGARMIRLSMCNKELFKEFCDLCCSNGKKKVTTEWAEKLGPIAFAFWYMDDGSIMNEHRLNQHAMLHTLGKTPEEVSILQEALQRFGMSSTLKTNKKGQQAIRIDTPSSEVFFSFVAPFFAPSMKYKLPSQFERMPTVFDYVDDFLWKSRALKAVEVKDIGSPSVGRAIQGSVYDIQTKNENYFVGAGCLVHNSGIQKGGGNYCKDKDLVVFDIKIGEWWLKREDVEELALKFLCRSVPVIMEGTLDQMVQLVKSGFNSKWGDFKAEGIVARPKVELKDRSGQRIITKLKYKDFVRG